MGYFSAKQHHYKLTQFLPLLLFLAILLLFVYTTRNLYRNQASEEKHILEQALSKDVTQCYALEGFYPPNIEYLVNHYGLTYNQEHFYIDYQYIGSNLRPDITIIER